VRGELLRGLPWVRGLIRGCAFDERGLIRGCAFGERGLIRVCVFGERDLIRRCAFGERGLIRGCALQVSECILKLNKSSDVQHNFSKK
jgi:hypothetical protein